MTGRERLGQVLRGEVPDCVPVAPDFSNMIPARRTGKPFWDLYLFQDPPIWDAWVDCARHFDTDALMDGYFPLTFPEETAEDKPWRKVIVHRDDRRIVTRRYYQDGITRVWEPTVEVYYAADPPTGRVSPARAGVAETPDRWEELTGVKPVDLGPAGLTRLKNRLGEQGLVGVFVTLSCGLHSQDDIYHYYDHPELHDQWARQRVEDAERRFARIMALDDKPDMICVGSSGTLVFQTEAIFRQLCFPAVKRAIELATAAGIPTHVHSCGPEARLVEIFAEETTLTCIDPLEMPPMGDCDLALLKRRFGDSIVLKGNLHTTSTMLHGSVDDVVAASKAAIDAAAAGGRFILSTGDQCGRDTPDENIHAMVRTARTYGRYD